MSSTLLLSLFQELKEFYTPSGQLMSIPEGAYLVTCPSPAWGPWAVEFLWGVRVFHVFCYALFTSRYLFQIFGNVDVYSHSILRFWYQLSKPFARLFMGILPCISGIDLGMFFNYFLFDKMDTFLNNIVIIDNLGNIYLYC